MFINFIVVLFLTITRCETRSVSIVVKHQQFFAVQDAEERGYIPVPEAYESLLQLTKPRKNTANGEAVIEADQANNNIKLRKNINEFKDTTDSDKLADDEDNGDWDDDDDENDDEATGTTLEDFLSANQKETDYWKSNDVSNNDFDIESTSGLRKLFRRKRSAHEQWKKSLPGADPLQTSDDTEPDVWEEVTDAELKTAQVHTYKEIAIYMGWTLLSVVGFVVVGICFLRDPIACIFAFGTGCPCCLICCPCIRSFTDKYLNMKNLVQDQMNKYMPGVIVNEDGSLDYYEPTGDELDILVELIDEMQDD